MSEAEKQNLNKLEFSDAPDTSDVIWENYSLTSKKRWLNAAFVYGSLLTALFVMAVIQFYGTQWQL
jgi:hypothetical protein